MGTMLVCIEYIDKCPRGLFKAKQVLYKGVYFYILPKTLLTNES